MITKKKVLKKRKKNKLQKIKKLFIIFILIFIIFKLLFFVWEFLNTPVVKNDNISYEVRGIDVSSYQGNIDWEVLSNQNLAFAFIKATEGSSHIDNQFKYNWEHANKTHLKVGAYHFMSFESSGVSQAQNFINTVPKTNNMLPPVVDVEFYGDFIYNQPSPETVDAILKPLLYELEKHYKQKPIIYVNQATYEKYIKGKYDNDIWYANLSMPDSLSDGKDWEFLQYSFTGVLEGYSGHIPHLDLNVYKGTKLEFINKY